VILVLPALIARPPLLAKSETPPDIVALERATLMEGGFLGAVTFRSIGSVRRTWLEPL